MKWKSFVCAGMLVAISFSSYAQSVPAQPVDVAVFGGTPGGVMAAVAAAREGHTVVLVEPHYFVGGLMAGGLTKTDIGRRDTVGGLAAEFFDRIHKYYETTYGPGSKAAEESKGGVFFEPHVAAEVFEKFLAESHVRVLKRTQLETVAVSSGHIDTITVRTGQNAPEVIAAKEFIDASYEGDLLAAAGVPYRVGREGAAEYGESLAGVNLGTPDLLGKGDHRVQSYNLRSTLTNVDANRVPIAKPSHYTPELYQDFLDRIKKQHIRDFEQLFPDEKEWGGIRGKYDPNKADGVGVNYNYPEGTPQERQAVYNELRDEWLSFWYVLQHDPSLSPAFRASALKWGLPKDEFTESGHVTPQIYVREARRMLGRYVIAQPDVERNRFKEDAVCMGSYNMDSHGVQRILVGKRLETEGFYIRQTDPWEVPYRALTPVTPDNLLVTAALSATHVAYSSLRMEPVFMMLGQIGGLAASDAIASNTSVQTISMDHLREQIQAVHIPFHAPFRPWVSIGVDTANPKPGEPVHFHVQQDLVRDPLTKFFWNFDGSGAVEASDSDPIWKFPAAKQWRVSLIARDSAGHESLVAYRTVNVGKPQGSFDAAVLFEHADVKGQWDNSAGAGVEDRGRAPRHDINAGKGEKSVTFRTALPAAGLYRVAFAYPPSENRASNVEIQIKTANGEKIVHLNERKKDTPFSFAPLGDFPMRGGEATVSLSNANTNGYVVADEVRWIWIGPIK